jgi:hypothetical protein
MSTSFTLWRRAAGAALQWRLMLLWVVALGLPMLLVTLPMWRALAGLLDHSLLGATLARGTDLPSLMEAFAGPRSGYGPAPLGAAGLLLTLLLSPWLTGTVVTAARAHRRLGLMDLAVGGLREYPRLARLLVWAVLPLGIMGGLGAALVNWAGDHALNVTLEADADRWQMLAMGISALLLLLAHASLDAARARLALQPQARSAVLAWWRGLPLLWRGWGRGWWLYLLTTLPGVLGLALLGLARAHSSAVGWVGVPAALLLGLALVAMTGWMRGARLFAMIEVGRPQVR